MNNRGAETLEFRLELGKSSFLRIPDQGPGQAQESSPFSGTDLKSVPEFPPTRE